MVTEGETAQAAPQDAGGASGDEDQATERFRSLARAKRRPWRSIVLAPQGDGTVRRRGSDGFRLVAAVLVVVLGYVLDRHAGDLVDSYVRYLTPPPNGVSWLVSAVWQLATLGFIVVVGAVALVSRRPRIARDLAVSGLAAWVVGEGVGYLCKAAGGEAQAADWHGVDVGFPSVRVAVTVAVACAALPYLSRSLQRVVQAVIAVTALAAVVHGAGLPAAVLAGLGVGWGTAAAWHLVVGSPLGLPSAEEVGVLIAEMGEAVSAIRPTRYQVWGVARYVATDPQGRVDVSVYGRDAADAQLLGKALRFLFYRDSGPTLSLTRLQQVEHEAYVNLMAQRAGARVPEVLAAGRAGPSGDAVLLTRPPPGERLADLLAARAATTGGTATGAATSDGDASDGDAPGRPPEPDDPADPMVDPADPVLDDSQLRSVLGQMLVLRAQRIAHGSVNPDNVVVGPGDRCGLVDFRCATAGATGDQLDRDLAGALATLTLASGARRVAAVATEVVDAGSLADALPFLQRAAFDTVTSRLFRGHKAALTALREEGAKGAGVETPKLAEPRRISWVTLVFVVGSLIGGWALLAVLIDTANSWSTIVGASIPWVIATFVLAQAAYPSNAVEVLGSVVDPLPFGRVTALESANAFVGLAGGSMAVLATRVRFFQQEGYDATLAVSSGVLVSTASWIVKGVLFVIAFFLAFSQFHFGSTEGASGSTSHLIWLIVLAVAVVGVALGVVLFVPRLRRLARDKLRPKAGEVLGHFKVLMAHPRKLVEIFAGCVASQLVVAMALGTSLHSFGAHLSLAALLIVLTLAAMLGGISPVPGGMGVVEAGMILCLTAAGITQTVAISATFVQRLFTAYLPPLWGWFILLWLRRKEYL